jgi:hypothetical protein
VVRAFVLLEALLEALLEGECDAERPPRNENFIGSTLVFAESNSHEFRSSPFLR